MFTVSRDFQSGGKINRLYTRLKDFHSHKWMYDSESLNWYLTRAGFTNVAQREFLDSEIEGIADIEVPDRVLNGAGVCAEGIKPVA